MLTTILLLNTTMILVNTTVLLFSTNHIMREIKENAFRN